MCTNAVWNHKMMLSWRRSKRVPSTPREEKYRIAAWAGLYSADATQ